MAIDFFTLSNPIMGPDQKLEIVKQVGEKILLSDSRVQKRLAQAKDPEDAARKLWLEPSEVTLDDHLNRLTGSPLTLLHQSLPPGFRALNPVDRLEQFSSELGEKAWKAVFGSSSDTLPTSSADHQTGEIDVLTNFHGSAFEPHDDEHAVGWLWKPVAKQVAKQVTKEAAKQVSRESFKSATRELVKQGVKEGIKEAAKETVKSPLQHVAKEAVKFVAGYFGIKGASELFNGMDAAEISESESVSTGRASDSRLNSEPQVIEALDFAAGGSFNSHSPTDQSAIELLVPGSAMSELNPKSDVSQPLLA